MNFFRAGSGRVADGTERGLDSPLLQTEEAPGRTDARFDSTPLASSQTAIVGTRAGAYTRVDEDSGARRERVNEEAMQRQQANQASFEDSYRQEEDRVRREARLVADDAKLAAQLQAEEDRRAGSAPQQAARGGGGGGVAGGGGGNAPAVNNITMQVTVPPNFAGGQVIRVQLPGQGAVDMLIPQGLGPGDTFTFKVPSRASAGSAPAQFTVRVPAGTAAGGVFRVILPNGRILNVGVPAGSGPGDELIVPFDDSTGEEPPQQLQRQLQQQQQQARAGSAARGGGGIGGSAAAMSEEEQQAQIAMLESLEAQQLSAADSAELAAMLREMPPDLHAEVAAQFKAQKRAAAAPRPPQQPPPQQQRAAAAPPALDRSALSSEQLTLLNSLDPVLRAEVERDMLSELAASRAQAGAAPPAAASKPPAPAPLPASSYPAPSAPSRVQEGDLLGFDAEPSPALARAPEVADLFQNLSVRGQQKRGDANQAI